MNKLAKVEQNEPLQQIWEPWDENGVEPQQLSP